MCEKIPEMSAEAKLREAFARLKQAESRMKENSKGDAITEVSNSAENLVWVCAEQLPILFAEMDAMRAYKENWDEMVEIYDWMNQNELARFMLNMMGGEKCSATIFNFLKRSVTEWEPELRKGMAERKLQLRKFRENRQALRDA